MTRPNPQLKYKTDTEDPKTNPTGSENAIVDAAHWRALQSLVAVVRTQDAPLGRSHAMAKLLRWLAGADGNSGAVGEFAKWRTPVWGTEPGYSESKPRPSICD